MCEGYWFVNEERRQCLRALLHAHHEQLAQASVSAVRPIVESELANILCSMLGWCITLSSKYSDLVQNVVRALHQDQVGLFCKRFADKTDQAIKTITCECNG